MKRLSATILCVVILGCRVTEEREALRPLPEKGNILSYQETHNRAKLQASAALDAFFVDNWLELEQTAQVLEQTAGHFKLATQPPDQLKKIIATESDSLRKDAVILRQAAKAKNVKTTNETLQRIHLTIRSLRPPE